MLDADMDAEQGYASAPDTDRSWLGRTGAALSPLRPAGIVEIAGTRLDVVSDGGFIEALAGIEVTRVDGNRIVVQQGNLGIMDYYRMKNIQADSSMREAIAVPDNGEPATTVRR